MIPSPSSSSSSPSPLTPLHPHLFLLSSFHHCIYSPLLSSSLISFLLHFLLLSTSYEREFLSLQLFSSFTISRIHSFIIQFFPSLLLLLLTQKCFLPLWLFDWFFFHHHHSIKYYLFISSIFIWFRSKESQESEEWDGKNQWTFLSLLAFSTWLTSVWEVNKAWSLKNLFTLNSLNHLPPSLLDFILQGVIIRF